MLTLDVEQQSLRYDTVFSCCVVCYNTGNSPDNDKLTVTSRLPVLASPHCSIFQGCHTTGKSSTCSNNKPI